MISMAQSRLILLAFFFFLSLPKVWAHSEDDDDFVEGDIIFQLVDPATLQQVLQDYELTLLDQVAGVATYLASHHPGTVGSQLVTEMLLDSRLRGAEIHRLAEAPESRFRTIALADGDLNLGQVESQPALEQMNATESDWDGSGILIAVLDTGIGPHPDLDAQIVAGYDFIDEDSDPSDSADGIDQDGDELMDEGYGHGTHVAGIIHLVAPRAKLMPVRVLNSEGQGSVFAIARGVRFAVESGAHILNCSWTLVDEEGSEIVEEALEYAEDQGVIVVTSAGNSNRAVPVEFPSSESHIISVGAVDGEDRKAEFSNFNDDIDFMAPGVGILSLYADSQFPFAIWSGTSMAAPFVSGAAALVLQAEFEQGIFDGEDLPSEVEDFLEGNVAKIDALNPSYPDQLGAGRLDLGLLALSLPRRTFPESVSVSPFQGELLLIALLGLCSARLKKNQGTKTLF